MKLTFLGTSAANAFPEPFCSCPNCTAARAEGGRSLRKRSSALLDGRLLIDLGPDILASANQHGIDLTGVQYCLQTHFHADHLDLSHLLSRSPDYGVAGAPRLDFYASAGTLVRARETFLRDLSHRDLLLPDAQEQLNLAIHAIEPYAPVDIGPYRVTPYPANHAHGSGAFIYAVRGEGGCLLYATDTAALFEEVWKAFHRDAMRFDLVVLDHTYGPDEESSDHLCAHDVAAHVARLREEGLLQEGGLVYATHIAHEGNPPHAELCRFAREHGYEVAYDGLDVSI